MIGFIFFIGALVSVIIIVSKNKRKKEVEFLMNESASYAVAVQIKDALVKGGYEVEEQPIRFCDGKPRGNFIVKKKDCDEYGNIYFSSCARWVDGAKWFWEDMSIRVIQGHLYAVEIAPIGLLVTSCPWSYTKGVGDREIPEFINIAYRIMQLSGYNSVNALRRSYECR